MVRGDQLEEMISVPGQWLDRVCLEWGVLLFEVFCEWCVSRVWILWIRCWVERIVCGWWIVFVVLCFCVSVFK